MFSKNFREELKLLWPFYTYLLLWGLAAAITGPVYILFYLNAGLSFTQLGIIAGISLFVGFLAEIPTGAIADVFGRKISVCISFLLWGITLILIPLFPQFTSLLIIVSLAELFSTLRSGADDAWAVDFLKHKKRSSLVHTFFIRKTIFMNVGFIIGGLVSVLVVTYFGIPATWFFEGVIVIGTAVFLFVFGEEWFKRKKVAFLSTLKSTLNKTREGLVYVRKHPVLLYYILGTFILMFQGILNLTWQPIFVDSGIQPAMIGLVLSLAGFIGIFTPMLSKKFLAVCRTEKNALIVYSTLLPLFTILLALSHNPVFVVLTYLLVSIIIDIGHPVELKLIHMFTESGKRATVSSVINMSWKLSLFLVFILNGALIDYFGLRPAVIIVTLLSMTGLIFYAMIRTKGQKVHI